MFSFVAVDSSRMPPRVSLHESAKVFRGVATAARRLGACRGCSPIFLVVFRFSDMVSGNGGGGGGSDLFSISRQSIPDPRTPKLKAADHPGQGSAFKVLAAQFSKLAGAPREEVFRQGMGAPPRREEKSCLFYSSSQPQKSPRLLCGRRPRLCGPDARVWQLHMREGHPRKM